MTPKEIILDAARRLPSDWPGRKDGVPYRILCRKSAAATPFPVPEQTQAAPIDAVSFRLEMGVSHCLREAWRIVGEYKGEKLVVTHGWKK